jgi:hypothetical protein
MKGLNTRAERRGFHVKDALGPRFVAQQFSRFQLSYDAVLSAAIVVARMITGGAYHAIVFGQVKSFNQFFGVGAILAAATVVLR